MHFLFEFKESWNVLTSLQKKLKEGFIGITLALWIWNFPRRIINFKVLSIMSEPVLQPKKMIIASW